MVSNADFTKGLNTEFDPIAQPPGTYRYLLNGIRDTDGSIRSERGTSSIKTFNVDMEIIGSRVIDQIVVLFLTDNTNHEIGILNEQDLYVTILNNSVLNFHKTNKVSVQDKVDYRGHRIVYFADGRNPLRRLDIDQVPTVDIEKELRLNLSYSTPMVNVTGVEDNGELPTGVYQFAARLVTTSFNKTPFGLVTNVVPIVEEVSTVGRDRYDGALPQTPSAKSIAVQIDNIDPSFQYIELVAITYRGLSNQYQASVIGLIPIQGRSSINYSYYSETQNKEDVSREELVQDFAEYDTAKYLEQKDGVLFAANLVASEAPISDIVLQGIANNVTLRHFIEEIDYSEDIRPQYATGGKDGKDIGTSPISLADYNGEMQTYRMRGYMRDEVYSFALVVKFFNRSTTKAYHIPGKLIPTGNELAAFETSFDYPTGYGFPTGKVRHHKMPSVSREPILNANQTKIRVLGVEATNITLLGLTAVQRSKIESIVLVRQLRRDIDKTILAQGIAQRLLKMDNKFHTMSPFTGMADPWNDAGDTLDQKKFGFYSPETVILGNSMIRGKFIRPVLRLRGTTKLIWDKRTDGRDQKFAHHFMNFNRYEPLTNPTSVELSSASTEYIPADNESSVPYMGVDGTSYSLRGNTGYVAMSTSTANFPRYGSYSETVTRDVFYNDISGTDQLIYGTAAGTTQNGDSNSFSGVTARYLYNITTGSNNVYGELLDATYIAVGVNSTLSSTMRCFSGDTFISKFSLVSAMREVGVDLNNLGLDLRTLNYFFVESTVNCNYRHYIPTRNDVSGTVPYYPKVKDLWTEQGTGILQVTPSLGHSTGYNKQYSFENNLVQYLPVLLGEVTVTKFPNRVIYSVQSIEGEQLDAFRIFLPNNYHDVSKNKGEITNLFVFNNTFYIHTAGSLYRSFVNESTTQATSSGDVYLGNGGLFPRPSIEIMTVSGGYAGSRSNLTTTVTPFGVFFVDNIQSKVFLLVDTLIEISDQGLGKFFTENPVKDGCAVYDYHNKRWILSYEGTTLSYAVELKSWSSFHSYGFTNAITKGRRTLIGKNNQLDELGTGAHGKYGTSIFPLVVRFVVNEVPPASKRFDNLVMLTTATKPNKIADHYDTFNYLKAYNKTVFTNKCEVIVPTSFEEELTELSRDQVFAKLKNHEFRLAIPSDLVINPNNDIFDGFNLHEDRVFRPRITGKYVEIELQYNNSRDNEFIVHTVATEFRQLDR